MKLVDKILVTGASGFIGCRLVEMLTDRGIPVRATVSNSSDISRVGRLPVEIVRADLTNPSELTRAAQGCSTIFHVAYRFGGSARQQEINFRATQVLADAFMEQGGRRFVQVSSMMSYGDPPNGDLSENTTPQVTSDPYCNVKRKIDDFLLMMHRNHGLPVTIIQPAIVYGPYGSIWSTQLLHQVTTTRIVLPMRGQGLCNAVYVDDVVSALMTAADCSGAIGEAFLISGAGPVTWRQFYKCYEEMVGRSAVLDAESAQGLLAKSPLRKLLERPPQKWLLAAVRKYVPSRYRSRAKSRLRSVVGRGQTHPNTEPPLFLPDERLGLLYASKTHIRIEKARAVLGYEPAFDLKNGMARTEQWARSAGLLGK